MNNESALAKAQNTKHAEYPNFSIRNVPIEGPNDWEMTFARAIHPIPSPSLEVGTTDVLKAIDATPEKANVTPCRTRHTARKGILLAKVCMMASTTLTAVVIVRSFLRFILSTTYPDIGRRNIAVIDIRVETNDAVFSVAPRSMQ